MQCTTVRISANDDYYTNWTTIKKACFEYCNNIIINNPHNPTGKILTQSDFEALGILTTKNPKIIVLSDEVYEYITLKKTYFAYASSILNRCDGFFV
jgi:methionine aminotransferase